VWSVIAAAAVILMLLFLLSPARGGSGVDQYRDDPLAHATAADAYESARILLSHPFSRLVVRARRVTRVWRDPGHCRDIQPNEAQAQYRATVRTYTWVGLPGRTIDAQCGGWHVSW
jgi:hypothetical protein